ncbi:MAG: prolyl oligopeptidase family serine peptidase [Acutalibacteraceae bacterium]|nr:prolyl oligopeptidase family serine peptidase [Acutalibacteraceae bacterium]
MIKEEIFKGIKYLTSLPEDFKETQKYPLVIFLHGAGTRSDNTELLRANPCFVNLTERQTRGYILVAPLCSVNNWNEIMSELISLTESLVELPFVDKTRVYLTGNSMGGYGTWELGALRPKLFAALMPVCGGGIPWRAEALKTLPIRTFHGLRDEVVDPIESLQMAKAVNKKGGRAELILFPECEHNCWDAVYTDEKNYDWLLSFSAGKCESMVEKLSGSYYG